MDYAEGSSWIAGKHIARLMRQSLFQDWESIFGAFDGKQVVGYCTFLKEDYYPDKRYSPWISGLFVDEAYRGQRIRQRLIEEAESYAMERGFSVVYLPSDHEGLYEKYGYEKIDTLTNYAGGVDAIFSKKFAKR